MRPGKHVFYFLSISSAATGFTLLLNWEVLGALVEAKTIVELDARSKEELAQGAFSIADILDIAAVVLEVIKDAGNISVMVEIEGKSSVDEQKIIQ